MDPTILISNPDFCSLPHSFLHSYVQCWLLGPSLSPWDNLPPSLTPLPLYISPPSPLVSHIPCSVPLIVFCNYFHPSAIVTGSGCTLLNKFNCRKQMRFKGWIHRGRLTDWFAHTQTSKPSHTHPPTPTHTPPHTQPPSLAYLLTHTSLTNTYSTHTRDLVNWERCGTGVSPPGRLQRLFWAFTTHKIRVHDSVTIRPLDSIRDLSKLVTYYGKWMNSHYDLLSGQLFRESQE